jgi:tetratricopeptide (TPR) repeat protein
MRIDANPCGAKRARRVSRAPDLIAPLPAAVGRAPVMSWLRLVLLSLVLGLACKVSAASPASLAAEFDSANKLYEQGRFREAATAYEQLVQSGSVSAALQFNLGNAFFKASQIGRAIAAYRQAERLDPRDPDIRANLQFARNQIQGPTLPPTRWQRWLGRLTVNEWAALAALALWVWLALLTVAQWRPGLKQTLRGYSFASGIPAAVLCLCLAAVLSLRYATPTAVVTAQDAIAHNGPLDESPAAFTVHDGAELRVLDAKEQWLQVSAGPQRLGWLRRDQVTLPPRL